jgi:hypothetical protein
LLGQKQLKHEGNNNQSIELFPVKVGGIPMFQDKRGKKILLVSTPEFF